MTTDFICSLSNSYAQVLDAIRVEENTHWYWGLRKAELFIYEKQTALDAAKDSLVKVKAKQDFLASKLSWLKKLVWLTRWFPLCSNYFNIHLLEVQVELENLQSPFQASKIAAQIRDCQMELAIATQERDRIVREHPEASQETYQQLQEEYSIAALNERKARFIASRSWAAMNSVPESVGVLIGEVTPEERTLLLERQLAIRIEGDTTLTGKIVSISAKLTDEEKCSLIQQIQEYYDQRISLLCD